LELNENIIGENEMRIALWGAGNTLNKVIDDINQNIHTIEFVIDSDRKKQICLKWGFLLNIIKTLR